MGVEYAYGKLKDRAAQKAALTSAVKMHEPRADAYIRLARIKQGVI
jgi:hypothetical protein